MEPLDGEPDRGRCGEHNFEIERDQSLDLLNRAEVGRVGHRDDQDRADTLNWDREVTKCEFFWNEFARVSRDFARSQIDRGHTVLTREELDQRRFVNEPELEERLRDGDPKAPGFGLSAAQILWRQVDSLGHRPTVALLRINEEEADAAPVENVGVTAAIRAADEYGPSSDLRERFPETSSRPPPRRNFEARAHAHFTRCRRFAESVFSTATSDSLYGSNTQVSVPLKSVTRWRAAS
jgi:hypothetical protein